jgi:hypothetical protein
MRVNWDDVYKERLKQIEEDKAKAVHERNWTKVAKLMDEKGRLEKLLTENQ